LGARRPPSLPNEEQGSVFVNAGTAGAAWLVNRLRTEWSPEVLDAAAFVLGDLGVGALPSILAALEDEPSDDQAEALLKALRLLPPIVGQSEARLAAVLSRFAAHSEAELRLAAYRATRCLKRDNARRILISAQRLEVRPQLRGLLDELLKELG